MATTKEDRALEPCLITSSSINEPIDYEKNVQRICSNWAEYVEEGFVLATLPRFCGDRIYNRQR